MFADHHIATGRATLAAEVAGDGDPVVFLHAAICDRRMWRPQLESLGEVCKAIAYDRRGFGKTQAAPENHSAVADLMAVIDALSEGKRAILVGCSQGARVALDAALMHPARVRGLVLIAPTVAGAPVAVYSPAIQPMMIVLKDAESAGDLDRVNSLKARLFLDGPLAFEGRVNGAARMRFLDMHGGVLRSPPAGKSVDDTPAFSRLGEIAIPSLVLWGEFDFPHIQDRSRQTAALMGGIGQQVADTAHLPSIDRPAAISGLLQEFVERCADSAK